MCCLRNQGRAMPNDNSNLRHYAARMPVTGEELHDKGREGAQRAKRWLDSTCRADAFWNNPEKGKDKLQYEKAGGGYFSFDLGGRMLGDTTSDELFLAEVKFYSEPRDQGIEYRRFAAKCYRVEVLQPGMFDHYMWITWAPFLVGQWPELASTEFVKSTITYDDACQSTAIGEGEVDDGVIEQIASKILVVVLAERQEDRLMLQGSELLHVQKSLLEVRH